MPNKNSINDLTTEEVLEKVRKLTEDKQADEVELRSLTKEMEEYTKTLRIEATPESIMKHKQTLETRMKQALKNVESLEEELLNEVRLIPNEQRRNLYQSLIGTKQSTDGQEDRDK